MQYGMGNKEMGWQEKERGVNWRTNDGEIDIW